MNYTQAWLEDPTSIRGILVEVTVKDVLGTYGTAGDETVIYLSNIGYITADSLTSYKPYLTGVLQTTESLSVSGGLSMSFGDIQIANPNGDLDSWLDSSKFIWVNRPIQIYLGDPRWVLDDLAAVHNTGLAGFGKIFDGVVADIDSSSREVLNLKVRDKLQRLNVPLTDNKLGTYGTWGSGQTNQDSIRPLVFGEVFNISPILVDPSLLKYMFNDTTSGTSSSNLVIEIRDNGVPIYTDASIYTNSAARPDGAIIDLNASTFTLKAPPAGTITASIQGLKRSVFLNTGVFVEGTYVNSIANLIALIVTQYGTASTRLTASDLDLLNLSTFSVNNTQAVGLPIFDRSNVLSVCQQLADSANAQLFINRLGKLQLLQIGVTTFDPYVTIIDDDILHHSLQISARTEVIAATKVGYCKNYTPQTALASSLPATHNVMYNEEWYSTTVIDTDVQAAYKLDVSPVQKDTNILGGIDATALATKSNNYFKVPRTTYSFTGTSKLLSLHLGQQVTLKHNRFGLSSGKIGQVISLSPNWLAGTINVEVII
jgi:hypothetical protein